MLCDLELPALALGSGLFSQSFAVSMPHRWSPAKLLARRQEAIRRGFVQQVPRGQKHVLVPTLIADRFRPIA